MAAGAAEAAVLINVVRDLWVVNLAAGIVHHYELFPSFSDVYVTAGATAWVAYDILITIDQEVSSIVNPLCTMKRWSDETIR